MRSVQEAGGVDTPLGGQLALAAGIPTAVWLDEIAAIAKMRAALVQARNQQRSTGTGALCVFVVYDLPGRDCSAASSAGELKAGELDRYEVEYVRVIEQLALEYPEVPKVFVLEPDSLPNVVTNMGRPKCAMVAEDYKNGIAIAIRRLGPLGTVYVDVGWSGWIGTWSATRMAEVLLEVFELAGTAASYVRGFVTNVSNYGSVSAEAAYATTLRAALAAKGQGNLAYIVDTGRNGADRPMGTWCNPRGAGMGEPPKANPPAPYADAFFWIKPPGESDGVSQSTAPRFDPECAKGGTWTGAPQAGEWFSESFVELVQQASPPLSRAPSYVPEVRPSSPPIPPDAPPPPPQPSPPPAPPEPVSDDDFFQEQRSSWLHSSAVEEANARPSGLLSPGSATPRLSEGAPNPSSTMLRTSSATSSATPHRRHAPPPPSPRPPQQHVVQSPAPSQAEGAVRPSLSSMAMLAFAAVFAMLSCRSDNAPARTKPGQSPKPGRTASALPPHVTRMAREARYAQVNTEGTGSAEETEPDSSPRPRRSRRKADDTITPADEAGVEEETDEVHDSTELVATGPRGLAPVGSEADGADEDPVLDEARAVVARLEAEKERMRLEREIEKLNARVASLDASVAKQNRELNGPSEADVEQALARLAREDAAKAGWKLDMDR